MLTQLIAALAYAPSIVVVFLALEFFMCEHRERVHLYNGEYYALAPSINSMTLAAKLNHELKAELSQSSGIYVIGGKCFNKNEKDSNIALSSDFLQKSILEESGEYLSAVKNSSDLLRRVLLPQQNEVVLHNEGFSALIFKSKAQISAILHLKVEHDNEYIFYETLLFYGEELSEKLEYRCCLREHEANWALAPGAEHFWLKLEPQDEEIGACMVLPDPFLTPGKGDSAFSRFTYFENVQR